MAQDPNDIFLGNKVKPLRNVKLDDDIKPTKNIPFIEEPEVLRRIEADRLFSTPRRSTEIGSLFVPKALTPFVSEPGAAPVTTSDETKQFLLQEMSRTEAQNQSSVENFLNAGYKALVPQTKAAYFELFGEHDTAMRILNEASVDFPTREGTSEWLGGLAGSVVPNLAALGATFFSGGAAAPIAFAVMANFGLQAAGNARGKIRAFEEESGEKVHPAVAAVVATGYGVTVFLAERMGFKWMRGAVDDLTGVALRRIAIAFAEGNSKNTAKVFIREILKVPIGTGAMEALEETVEQTATNMIDIAASWVDTVYQGSDLFQNVPEAALGGFVGGAFIGGVGGTVQSINPRFRRGAVDGFVGEAQLSEPLDSGIQAAPIEVDERTPIDELLERNARKEAGEVETRELNTPDLTGEELLDSGMEPSAVQVALNRSIEEQRQFILEQNKMIIVQETKDIADSVKPVESLNALELQVHEMRQVAEIMENAFVDIIDVEARFKRVGLPLTGTAVKTMYSVRAEMADEGLQIMKKSVGALGRKRIQYLDGLVLNAENQSLLDNIPKNDIAEVMRANVIVRDYFDQSITQYQQQGGLQQGFKQNLIDRLEKEISRAQKKKDVDKIKKLQKDMKKARSMEFVHIPYGFWFEDRLVGDPTMSTRFLKLLEAIPRRTILIQDLIDEGVLDAGDVKLADVIASYSRRKGFDFSLLKIVNAAKAEGAALELKRGERPQAGFVVAPSSAPILKGFQLHPVLAEFLTESTVSPLTLGGIRRGLNVAKMSAFINPVFLPMYDTIQAAYLGAFSPLRPFKTMKHIKNGVLDTWNRTPEYYQASYAGARSTPYNNPLSSIQQQQEAAAMLGGIVEFYIRKTFDVRGKNALDTALKIGALPAKIPANIFKLAYNVAFGVAWASDGMIRQISYRYLTDEKGMTPRDAASRVALIHGDYAGVPGRTRRALNTVAFTPTFKIAMAKAFTSMVQDAGKVIKGDQNADTYDNAMGLVRVLGILAGIDMLMKYGLGWEREEFGRIYKKRVQTDEGEKELVTNLGGPHNLIQKFIMRWFDATGPEITNSMEKFLRSMSWELHPIWRKGSEIVANRDSKGDPIVSPFMTGREKTLRRVHHALTGIVSMYRIIFAEGAESQEAVEAFRKESGQLLEMILSGFTFKYLRDVPELQLERDVQRIQTTLNNLFKDPDRLPGEDELKNALFRIEKIIKIYNEKSKLLNQPYDTFSDDIFKVKTMIFEQIDSLRNVKVDEDVEE